MIPIDKKGIITTDNPFFIRLLYGKRTGSGKLYPTKLTLSWRLALKWMIGNFKERHLTPTKVSKRNNVSARKLDPLAKTKPPRRRKVKEPL